MVRIRGIISDSGNYSLYILRYRYRYFIDLRNFPGDREETLPR